MNEPPTDSTRPTTTAPHTRQALVRTSYEDLLAHHLGDRDYLMYSINLPRHAIAKALEQTRTASGHLPSRTLPLSQEFYNATRSGVPTLDAGKTMYGKFLRRYEKAVLGSSRKHGKYLNWAGAFENSTKRYINEPVSHLHLLLELPNHRISPFYVGTFRDLFGRLIYPHIYNTKILNIEQTRIYGLNNHREYSTKQLVDWTIASDRILLSEAPRNDYIQ